jgi:hypothetical protein
MQVLIPYGTRMLVLSSETLQKALADGDALAGSATTAPAATADLVLDVDGMEARTGIPASWWAEAARKDIVPHIRAGKYVRFRLSEALDALAAGVRPKDKQSFALPRRTVNQ